MSTMHLLSRAVVRKRNRVLVVAADGQPHTFLPGGHVEEGEGVKTCLQRELREELGVASDIESYLGVVEHQWHRDGATHYELNHCFSVEIPSLSPETQPTAQEDYLTFDWVRVENLRDVDLQPAPLRSLLRGEQAAGPWWASTLSAQDTEGERAIRTTSVSQACTEI